MEIIKEQTDKSPLVTFDGVELVIKGRSYMENSQDFYRTLIAQVQSLQYERLDVIVILAYFNTSSSKCLLELFHAFERLSTNENPVAVFWYYAPDCPDLEEAGEDYRDLITGIKFELIEEADE